VSDTPIDALVTRYGALIRRIVARVGGRAIAGGEDDIEQDVIVSLWKQVSREQTIDHPTSYIYRAAVRETVRAVRRELERKEVSIDSTTEASAIAAAGDPSREFESIELRGAIEASIAALSPERALAVRAHLAGYDVAEIMRMYDWPYQKARNLVSRGIADLREALRREGVHG
jgi:RNA polymerase sigma factor (sigma-70 family)